MSISVVIPSRNVANLTACVAAVKLHEPEASIIVVDDGIEGWSDRWDVLRICGAKPFCFARNCNLGIKVAGKGAGVVLLNDDAILETPGGFSAMQRAAASDPTIMLISATTNVANNPALLPLGHNGLRLARRAPGLHFPSVPFVCVLIPARTLQTIGLLDERYVEYGWEDTDYCRRIWEAGGKIGIHDGCYVDHGSLTSTFRGDPRAPGPIDAGRKIYEDKWR